jgi:hypothetical protein
MDYSDVDTQEFTMYWYLAMPFVIIICLVAMYFFMKI